jgi:hypothetical protein
MERHSQYQTVSNMIACKERHFSDLHGLGFFYTAAARPVYWKRCQNDGAKEEREIALGNVTK